VKNTSELLDGLLAFTFLICGLALFYFGMRASVEGRWRLKYTDDSGCKHYSNGYIERIECKK
jgi:hypothetical protein